MSSTEFVVGLPVDVDDDCRCRLDGLSVYTSSKQCEEMLEFDQSGEGMDENFERLDELISSLQTCRIATFMIGVNQQRAALREVEPGARIELATS